MNITDFLASKCKDAAVSLYGTEVQNSSIQIQATRKDFEGDYTLVVFPLLRISKSSPEATAEAIGRWLQDNVAEVASYNVIKGFLNIVLSPLLWNEVLQEITSESNFGTLKPNGKTVMIEFSSPNTNKPLHLGHIRNILLGWSMSQLMEAGGYRVIRANLVNDRGIHICKSMIAWLKAGNGITPESSGIKGDHLVGDFYVKFNDMYKAEVEEMVSAGYSKENAEKNAPILKEAQKMLVKWEQGDNEVRTLWRKMNEWVYAGFNETYRTMGVGFDKIYYESDTYLVGKSLVEDGLDKGIFFRKDDGSVWADLRNEGLDEKLLIRADGTSVYMTQDIGTAKLRYQDFPIKKMIYVVGNEQDYHFKVLSILLDRLGFEWGKSLVHFSYGMVTLPNGKMKSREGTVVDADDLMEEMVLTAKQTSEELGKFADIPEDEKAETARIVGMGALKYFLLKVDARKNMLFNPEESIDFNGNTGPFIQYTYARIRSVLRKANAQGLDINSPVPAGTEVNDKEAALIQLLADFDATVRQAGEDMSPSIIANYCYDLVKEYNQFYHDYSILREENEGKKRLRLVLSANVAKIVRSGMNLLGIEMPERM